MNKPLTTAELAQLYHTTPAKVRGWIARGCPCWTTNGMPARAARVRVYFDAEQVANWHRSFSAPNPFKQAGFNFNL